MEIWQLLSHFNIIPADIEAYLCGGLLLLWCVLSTRGCCVDLAAHVKDAICCYVTEGTGETVGIQKTV